MIAPFPKFLESLPGSDVNQARVKDLMEWNGRKVNSLPLLLTNPQAQVTSFFRLMRELGPIQGQGACALSDASIPGSRT